MYGRLSLGENKGLGSKEQGVRVVMYLLHFYGSNLWFRGGYEAPVGPDELAALGHPRHK